MAGVLATLAVNLRTKLAAAPASLTALPENQSIDDTPDADKVFVSVEPGAYDELDNEHGGGTYVMRVGEIAVRIAWNLDVDEEAFQDTKADDLENVVATVDKVSNWTSGIVLLTRTGTSETRTDKLHRADLTYRVRYRVAQTLT